jgi:AhpD family alkylhydroperoxidase
MQERISFQDTPAGFMNDLLKIGYFIKKAGLDDTLHELINTRASQINGCAYCLDMHHKDAIARGETWQRLYSLPAWRETPYYTEKERAVLAYTEALTLTKDADDEVFNALSAHFSKDQVAVLTLAVATINTWNILNKAFRTIPGGYKPGMFDQH